MKVTRRSSPRVPASVSASELSAHHMAPAGESDELAGEPGGALYATLADLQRWRRGLRRRDGGGEGGVEAAVAVLTDVGKRAVHAALEFHSCIALVTGPAMGWGAAGGGCLHKPGAGAPHTGDELMLICLSDLCIP